MEYCLNINTNILKKYITINIGQYNYTFLDNIKLILYNYDIYYDIINTYEEFKLKNIYNFIYNRILILNKLYDINNLEKINIELYISKEKFNDLLLNYINNDIIKSIIVINSIQQYYKPLRILKTLAKSIDIFIKELYINMSIINFEFDLFI